MFDTYVNRHTTDYVDRNITLNVHRAPTDESVKIFNEMTEKALKNIVKTFSTTNNTLQATVAVYDDYRNQQREFLCKFILNGKENILHIDIPVYNFETPEKMVQELYKQVCDKLALEIMQPFLKELNKGMF